MKTTDRIAVIGAGMAGMAAARVLHDAGIPVIVFEKSRGYGGRSATKRWEGHVIDHGAQYFTLRSPEFRRALEDACGSSLRLLDKPILGSDLQPLSHECLYYHVAGNSRLARDLAVGLEVRLEHPVTSPVWSGSSWQIGGASFSRVVCTAPWPQTRVLAGLDPDPDTHSTYHPCLTLLLSFAGAPHGKARDFYAFSDPGAEVLAWTACENHKTGRITGDQTVLVAQASPAFSREFYEAEPTQWAALLCRAAQKFWEMENISPAASYTHRWRYARVARPPDPCPLPPGWHYAGDARTKSRLESSWLDGRAVALEVLAGMASPA